MYPNPLKQKLKNGELILGTVLPAPSAYLTTLTCQTDINFLWIDTEHAPFGTEALDAIPTLARRQGVAPMIRVAWNDPALIKKAYDIGAVAVMVPQINTAEEAARAVQYARYPPEGQRGVSPLWPLIAGEDWGNVIRTANAETVLVLQIESQEAYDNLDAIAQVPGIDVLFVGPMDLSASLGVITQTGAPAVQKIMRDIGQRLQGTNIVVGTTLDDVAEIQEKISWGYRFLNVGSPLGYGIQALQQHLATLRANPTRK
jgi:4-hydroxy-2-oxoheptanedioate aldolase